MIAAKTSIANGPATQPNWAVLHARDNTPAPITPVITCAIAVHIVPRTAPPTKSVVNYVLPILPLLTEKSTYVNLS